MERRSSPSFAYVGSINDAIAAAQKEKKLFLVYISGENEDSIRLEQATWADSKVPDAISKYCIFLHLKQGSVEASQFSAIYPSTAFPSITAVGFTGAVVWKHEGYVDAEAFLENIRKAWASLHLQETTAKFLAAALASNKPAQVSSSYSSGASEVERGSTSSDSSSHGNKSASGVNVICADPEQVTEQRDGGSAVNLEVAKASEVACSLPSVRNESTIVENSRTDSIEVKEIPHSTSEVKENTTTYLNDSWAEIPKEDENRSASNLKPGSGISTRKEASPALSGTTSDEPETSRTMEFDKTGGSLSASKSNDVHINIRLPDGSSLQTKIVMSDTLQVIKNHVDENTSGSLGPYYLAVPYPRQVFNDQDMDKVISELGFGNRQALIVIPNQPVGQSPSTNRASAMTTDNEVSNANAEGYFGYAKRMLSYINIFSYFGGNDGSSSSQQARDDSPRQYSPNSGLRYHEAAAAAPSSIQQYNQNRQNPSASDSTGGVGVRRRARPFGSNIHTLRHDEDEGPSAGGSSDDRNMFWNGNSTQFGGGGGGGGNDNR